MGSVPWEKRIRFGEMLSYSFLAILIRSALAQPSVPCSKPLDGEKYFVSDGVQCDKFHMCNEQGNLAAEFLCEDGLIFEALTKQCVLPFKSNCLREGKTQLQEPEPVGNCPRQNGKWAGADTDCRAFFTCSVHTKYHPRLAGCPVGTVFND